jgi:hypothetical protein
MTFLLSGVRRLIELVTRYSEMIQKMPMTQGRDGWMPDPTIPLNTMGDTELASRYPIQSAPQPLTVEH